MSTTHSAVWLDHNEARIFHVTKTTFDETTVHSEKGHAHVHRKAGVNENHDTKEDASQGYYHEVLQALAGSEQILVLGPSTAKLELVRHAHRHNAALQEKIIGVETVDHPSDAQLVAYIRKYFKEGDVKHSS